MTVIRALQQRNSHPRVSEPGPTGTELDDILQAGLRAPDHGRLRPWHFLVVEGDRRAALGEVFATALTLANPAATEAEVAKARSAPLRAPLVIAGLLKPKEHPKVPRVEQAAAVACALHAMLLAAESMGYGGVWRTGNYARDPFVVTQLGGDPSDEVIGFLYIGTRQGPSKNLVPEATQDYVTRF